MMDADPGSWFGYCFDRAVFSVARTIKNEFERTDSKHRRVYESAIDAVRATFPIQMYLIEHPGSTVEDYEKSRDTFDERTVDLLMKMFGSIVDYQDGSQEIQ